MDTDSFLLLVGFALLLVGGDQLVRAAGELALRLGISPLIVGLVVVGFGTSSPELAVGLDASALGHGDVAVGNVLGSNLCNVALILGLSAVARPIQVPRPLVLVDVPILTLASAVVCLLLLDGTLGRIDGVVLLLGIAAYLRAAARRAYAPGLVADLGSGDRTIGLPRLALRILVGFLALGLGAHWLVRGAVDLASDLGVDQDVIAMTVVALGSSMPELATTLVAAMRGRSDLAAANIVGSNVFNLLAILGASASLRPLVAPTIELWDLGALFGISLLLWLAVSSGSVVRREGAMLVAAYVGYLVFVIVRA